MDKIKRTLPSKKQRECRFCYCFLGKNHDQCVCKLKRTKDSNPCDYSDRLVNEDECERCEEFESKFIQYPIQVNNVHCEEYKYNTGAYETGTLVKCCPCSDEEGKTYLGILLGNLPIGPNISYKEDSRELTIGTINNPAIYVFELKRIVFGMECWWQEISSVDDFKQITQNDISNQWYVKLFHGLYME